MIGALLIAATLAGTDVPAGAPLAEAAAAIEAGRLEQARIMIGNAVQGGATGPAVDRLLADYAFASGDFHGALARYSGLLEQGSAEPLLVERAGIAALRVRDSEQARFLLDRAVSMPGASWRAWNARGVAADHDGEWDKADSSYARAARAAPDRAEIMNNMGWSKLVRGDWHEAVGLFERAAALDPHSQRIADNLELARAAVSEDLPIRRKGESETEWASRLNDAGVIARVRGDRKRAIAAFTRALEARSQWFERAANNLAQVEAQR